MTHDPASAGAAPSEDPDSVVTRGGDLPSVVREIGAQVDEHVRSANASYMTRRGRDQKYRFEVCGGRERDRAPRRLRTSGLALGRLGSIASGITTGEGGRGRRERGGAVRRESHVPREGHLAICFSHPTV